MRDGVSQAEPQGIGQALNPVVLLARDLLGPKYAGHVATARALIGDQPRLIGDRGNLHHLVHRGPASRTSHGAGFFRSVGHATHPDDKRTPSLATPYFASGSPIPPKKNEPASILVVAPGEELRCECFDPLGAFKPRQVRGFFLFEFCYGCVLDQSSSFGCPIGYPAFFCLALERPAFLERDGQQRRGVRASDVAARLHALA
jgi:hypothetical protein